MCVCLYMLQTEAQVQAMQGDVMPCAVHAHKSDPNAHDRVAHERNERVLLNQSCRLRTHTTHAHTHKHSSCMLSYAHTHHTHILYMWHSLACFKSITGNERRIAMSASCHATHAVCMSTYELQYYHRHHQQHHHQLALEAEHK